MLASSYDWRASMSMVPGEVAGATFGDALAARVAARESQIVLGLDPDPAALWPGSWELAQESSLEAAALPDRRPRDRRAVAAAVLAHCRAAIDAAGPACVAVKPQLACFERFGAPGWEALEAVVEHARGRVCSRSPTASAATSRSPPRPTGRPFSTVWARTSRRSTR